MPKGDIDNMTLLEDKSALILNSFPVCKRDCSVMLLFYSMMLYFPLSPKALISQFHKKEKKKGIDVNGVSEIIRLVVSS